MNKRKTKSSLQTCESIAIKYEVKKVFSKTGGKIAVLLLMIVLGTTCFLATRENYVNEKGITETGFAAARKLRSAKKKWAGILDESKIKTVIIENVRISATPEAQSKSYKQNDIAYSWKQGFSDIREMLNRAYAGAFRDYDYYTADSLTAEDAEDFYSNRILLLKTWLNGEAKDQFSEAEKQYLIKQYKNLKTPFYYDYSDGWRHLVEYSPTIIMITMLILGYLVAGIFSCEFQWKADSIFFTAFHGRNKAVTAKIKAGFYMVTAIYSAVLFLYTAIVLLYLGTDGADCIIQFAGWKSIYNITFWQEYLLIVSGGYLGCLFISSLTMWISAKMKSAVIAVMLPFIIIFFPSFISGLNISIINKILGLLPDRLLQTGAALNYIDLYQFGNKIIPAIPILLVLYTILIIILVPVIYQEYRHKQVN